MTDQPTSAPKTLRLDPAPSQVFSWLEWREDAPAVKDDDGRLLQPAGTCLTVKFRNTGSTWCYFPVSRVEAQAVMAPDARYDFSVGRAFSDLIRGAGKSSRQVQPADRQAAKDQQVAEGRAGAQQAGRPDRRWLA